MKVAWSLIVSAALVFPSALFPATQTAQDKDAQSAAPAQAAPTQAAPTQAAPAQAAPTQATPAQAAPAQATPAQAVPTPAPAAPVAKEPFAFGLEDGTPVRLSITRTISSADAQLGEKVEFEVVEDVKVHDVIVIARGGKALATVTQAQPKRRMGRVGKLDINVASVRLASGQKVPLRAVKDARGGSHLGTVIGGAVATSIIFPPAAPLFLLVHGKDIVIPKGTEITAYIDDDIQLDPAKFAPATASK